MSCANIVNRLAARRSVSRAGLFLFCFLAGAGVGKAAERPANLETPAVPTIMIMRPVRFNEWFGSSRFFQNFSDQGYSGRIYIYEDKSLSDAPKCTFFLYTRPCGIRVVETHSTPDSFYAACYKTKQARDYAVAALEQMGYRYLREYGYLTQPPTTFPRFLYPTYYVIEWCVNDKEHQSPNMKAANKLGNTLSVMLSCQSIGMYPNIGGRALIGTTKDVSFLNTESIGPIVSCMRGIIGEGYMRGSKEAVQREKDLWLNYNSDVFEHKGESTAICPSVVQYGPKSKIWPGQVIWVKFDCPVRCSKFYVNGKEYPCKISSQNSRLLLFNLPVEVKPGQRYIIRIPAKYTVSATVPASWEIPLLRLYSGERYQLHLDGNGIAPNDDDFEWTLKGQEYKYGQNNASTNGNNTTTENGLEQGPKTMGTR